MPELNDTLKQNAALFVSGELSEKERRTFEAELKNNESLRAMVDELTSSISLSKSALDMKPSDALLQSQRIQLRNAIDSLEKEQPASEKPRSIQEFLLRFAGMRQPAWAVAVYITIAFFMGQFYLSPPSNGLAPAVSPTQDIMELIEAGALQQVNIKERENGGGALHLGLRTARDYEVSGNPEDDFIQKILLYLLLNDSNPGNRLKAVKYLNTVPKHDTMKMALMSSILSDPNPGVRLRSLKLLNEYEVDNLLSDACLKVLLEDENEAVRMGALEILSKSPSADIVPALQVVSMMDENEFIRNRSLEILDTIEELNAGEKIEVIQ